MTNSLWHPRFGGQLPPPHQQQQRTLSERAIDGALAQDRHQLGEVAEAPHVRGGVPQHRVGVRRARAMRSTNVVLAAVAAVGRGRAGAASERQHDDGALLARVGGVDRTQKVRRTTRFRSTKSNDDKFGCVPLICSGRIGSNLTT